MEREKWQAVKEIFYSALQRAPAERGNFLVEACKGDEALRRELNSLLASYNEAQDFMDPPAIGEWLMW
jgi:hypothetical protein